MSNDLLFSIIPRANNRVPVIDRGQIKRIDAAVPLESLNEEERALHNEQRRVTEKEQYREHSESGNQQKKKSADSQHQAEQEGETITNYDESGHTHSEEEKPVSRRKHIDKYV